MAKRVWMWTTATVVLLGVAWLAAASANRSPVLRSAHSYPAVEAPAEVVVTAQGKLFHRPECTFVHGPTHTETGARAIADGYTACTRCLPRRAASQ